MATQDAERNENTEVLIIGAGPIGIELAAALTTSGISYLHLEAGCIGATIHWYAPGTQFFSSPERLAIAGIPLETSSQQKPFREEYLRYLRQVARKFNLKVRTFERVSSLRRSADGFVAESHTQGGERRTIYARKVVLAIGDMHRPRLLKVSGEELPHVSHYLQDPHFYTGRRVLVVGGRNSAVEAALRLYRVGAQVSMSYRQADFDLRRVKYWLHPELRALVRKGAIRFYPATTVETILPHTVMLRESDLRLTEVEAQSVLLLTGYEQERDLFEQIGIRLEGEGGRPVLDPRTMQSNIEGVYVCGTASAGTQLGGVKEFIETSHVHVGRILASLRGEPPPPERAPVDPEWVEQ